MPELSDVVGCTVLRNEPMARHTSFKVGGPADWLVFPESEGDILSVLRFARDAAMPLTILGAGTNVIVRDGGIRGIVMSLGPAFGRVEIEGQQIRAQAGVLLHSLCLAAAEGQLSGLEWAIGIPGTLGGAVVMNAGAFGGEMKDVVERVRVLDLDGEVREVPGKQMEFGYRTSLLKHGGLIAVGARLALKPGRKRDIEAKHHEILDLRRSKQPLDLPSAGSIFERPPGHYAGDLIERAGLKGFTMGGAQVSPRHANFIVNLGDATASDILQLIRHVREVVEQKSGVTLKPEVVVLGEDGT